MASLNNLVFSEPKPNRSGGQQIFLNYKNVPHDQSKLAIQLPKSKVPFGVTSYNSNKSLSIQICDTNLETFFYELDTLIKSNAKQNSFKWFKKSMHETVLEELYKPQIKQNKNFPPLISVKIPNKFDDIYDSNNTKILVDAIQSKDFVETELVNNGIYFINSSFGTSWKLQKLIVHKSHENAIKGYSFLDDDEDV